MLRLSLITAAATLALAAPAAAQIGSTPPPPPPPPPPVLAPVDPAIAPQALQRIYRGDDGSAYYQRVVGTTVVGFGEHPGRDYAFVFRGTVSSDGKTITGTSWDVAKGSRTGAGAVAFGASNGGTRLAVASGGPLGATTYETLPAENVTWTGPRQAGFQSIFATDLDGAFDGSDGSRAYVRESNGTVVWVAEAKANQRPAAGLDVGVHRRAHVAGHLRRLVGRAEGHARRERSHGRRDRRHRAQDDGRAVHRRQCDRAGARPSIPTTASTSTR